MNSVFLVRTPLQYRIARRIVSKNNIKSYKIIILADVHFDTYSDTLIIYRTNKLFEYLKIRKHLLTHDYNEVYIASISNYIFQACIKCIPLSTLYTFDDGSANLLSESAMNKKSNFKDYIKGILFNFILKLPDERRIKEIAKLHYTIFEPVESSNRLVYLDNVFNSIEDEGYKNHQCKKATILIGSCYKELSKKSENLKKLIYSTLPTENIYYIPHPRSKDLIFFNIPVIKSGYVAEEVIQKMLLEGCEEILVIGCFSTTHLNLHGIPGISLIVLDSDIISTKYRIDQKVTNDFPNIKVVDLKSE